MTRLPRAVLTGLCGVVLLSSTSSCALKQLKEKNERLNDANNRLVAKYNSLERQVADLEKQLSERNREIASMRDRGDASAAEATPVSVSTSSTDDFAGLGLESKRTADGTLIRLEHAVFFELGKAGLSREGKRILSRVSQVLQSKYGNRVIRVEGHTDDTPVRKVRHIYPSNWELSTARACSVVRYLVDSGGVNPHRIYPAGFAFHRPRDRSKSKNRRVEILILDESA